MDEIKVKALVDKEKNKVVFVESNANFVDMLFSFLTMPMGTIIRLTSEQQSAVTLSSMKNLYRSVKNLSVNYFWTSGCRDMLLSPRSGAETHLKKIRTPLEEYSYFFADSTCTSQHKLFSSYKHTSCHCGKYMDNPIHLRELASGAEDEGVFVKGFTQYLISDDLRIVPLSTIASFSMLSEQGVTTASAIEEKVFGLGKNEILNLLKRLLASKNPLTETLLKNSLVKEPNKEFFYPRRAAKKRKMESSSEGGGNIRVKLILSKSSNVVCFAEASEDFIDLLFSFLVIPLGNIQKEMHGNAIPFEGCACHLHESVQKLDARNLISDEIKQLLLCPEVAHHFGFHKDLLGVKEVRKQYYCTLRGDQTFVSGNKLLFRNYDSSYGIQELTLLDPKSSCKNKAMKSSGGYVKGPMMFTITDDLVITTSSAISGLAILNKLNVPLNDIEERTVHVGKEEAIRLLVASFISKSPLTDVFTREVPKEEY